MHDPVEPGDVGKVGFTGELRVLRDGLRQVFAPASQVTVQRRLVKPLRTRHGGKRGLAHQLRHRGVGFRQGAWCQRRHVGAVGRNTERSRGCGAREPCAGGVALVAQQGKQALLAFGFRAPCVATRLALHRTHAPALAHAASRVPAASASDNNTASGGRSLSHSIKVGTGPTRANACSKTAHTDARTRLP